MSNTESGQAELCLVLVVAVIIIILAYVLLGPAVIVFFGG